MRIVSLSFLLCLLTSCATPGSENIGGLDYPLTDIQKGIKKAFPVPFKNISRDGRIFESYPFIREGKKLVLSRNQPERGRALIEIRGVSRPYSVDVLIHIDEALNPSSVQKNYKSVGYDEVVAKIFLARLRAYLLKSKKSLDIVDDVRVY